MEKPDASHDLFVENAADAIIAHYKKCIAAGKTIEYELDIVHRGKRYVVYAELNPIIEKGTAKYIVGSSTDITEHRIRAAGCDDYISKPISGQQLLQTIERHAPGLRED